MSHVRVRLCWMTSGGVGVGCEQEIIATQRRELTALLRDDNWKSSVQKKWRKVVTGDETKRVRDHIRCDPLGGG
jgi:hypothetical protein